MLKRRIVAPETSAESHGVLERRQLGRPGFFSSFGKSHLTRCALAKKTARRDGENLISFCSHGFQPALSFLCCDK